MRPFFYHKIPLFQQYLDTDEELGLLMVDSVLILLSLTIQTFLWLLEKLLPCWKTHDVLICHSCKTTSLLKYTWFKDEPQPWNWFIVEINNWCKTEPQQYPYVCAICLKHIHARCKQNKLVGMEYDQQFTSPLQHWAGKASEFRPREVWSLNRYGGRPQICFCQ